MLLPFAVGGAYLLKELRLDRKDVRVAMAVAVAATLVVAIHVNYINYANDDEMLVYVQTKPEFVQLVGILKKKLEMGEGVWVIEPENDYWPLPWYLRNYEVSFSRYPPDQINTTVVTSYSYEEEILNRINYEPVKVYYELRPGYYMVLIQKR
jgi:predicted membrane-bound mannosyltransferase